MSKNDPHLRLDIVFVPYGYQADIYSDGKHVGTECRDFSDDHKVELLVEEFYQELLETIKRFRKKH